MGHFNTNKKINSFLGNLFKEKPKIPKKEKEEPFLNKKIRERNQALDDIYNWQSGK